MGSERQAELTRRAEEAYADGALAKEALGISEQILSIAPPIDEWDDDVDYTDLCDNERSTDRR